MADLTKILDNGTTERYQSGGAAGQAFVDQLYGKYYELLISGQIFIAAAAVGGTALPIYSATAQTFMIWNPANSGYNLKPICAKWGYKDTTSTAAFLCWGYKTSMGSATGTGAPCSAYTGATPVNALLGSSGDSTTLFAPATATVIAPSFLRPAGPNTLAAAGNETAAPYSMVEFFDEDPLIIAPGSALFACNSIAASTKWCVSVTYAKIAV